ncbi:MAG: Hsp20/alpha crystallin family protein [Candidatus Krumholzibacteriaceae bacterium]
MAIIRWNPIGGLVGLEDEMRLLFGDFLGPDRAGDETRFVRWAPRVDIAENDGHYELTADLPGLKKDDIKIEIHDNTLTLRGEKKVEEEKKENNYRLAERYYGEFVRVFTLPENVNKDSIEAEFKDGVLKLTIPKTEQPKPKQIEVKVK